MRDTEIKTLQSSVEKAKKENDVEAISEMKYEIGKLKQQNSMNKRKHRKPDSQSSRYGKRKERNRRPHDNFKA